MLKYKIFFVLFALFLVGCATKTTVSKKEAIDTFVKRANKTNDAFERKTVDKSLSRQLIQFTYGPDSLKNTDFLEYLILSRANLSLDLIKELKGYENTYALLQDTRSSQDLFYEEKLQGYKKEFGIYKGLAETTSATFSNIKLSKALGDLVGSIGLKVEGDLEERRLQGQYSGSLFEILREIGQQNKLFISFSEDFNTLVFSSNELLKNPKIDPNFIKEAFLAEKDWKILNKIMGNLSKTNGQSNTLQYKKYVAQLKSRQANTFIDKVLFELKENKLVEAKNLEASKLRRALITYSEAMHLKNSDQPKTAAILKSALKDGDENAIEKFNVYHDSPDNMKKILDGHPIFKLNCAAPTAAPTAAPDVALSNKLHDCVTLSKDTTGIVASGLIHDIQLVERLLSNQDLPVKQAMIEVFILEVNKDWQRTIKAGLTGKEGANPGKSTFTSDVAGMALTTGMNIKTLGGSLGDIGMLINLIESNSAGRTISNPVILVKDGETGSVNKIRTVRKEQPTAPVVSISGVSTPSPPTIVELTSPLKMDIKATINKHNDNIELDFSFTETVLDTDTVTSAGTQNEIKSKLIAQPGQIITMAGLYKERNSNNVKSIPGIPDAVSNFLGPLIAMFGGSSEEQKAGSELLVFINASVITTQDMDKTMNYVHD